MEAREAMQAGGKRDLKQLLLDSINRVMLHVPPRGRLKLRQV